MSTVDRDVVLVESLAPVLGAKRDGTASVDTSRGLLTTVLGEFVLPSGGSAWTQTLVAVMEQLGVREKSARQAIARLHDRGWLDRARIGRRTRWTLTPSATQLLGAGAERIYGFGLDARPWDGRWLVLLASVPERDRGVRYRMTNGLNWAGFGSLGQGTWISPWSDRESTAVDLLHELGIDATSFHAELGAMGSESDLAAQAWALPELRERYDDFLDDVAELADVAPKPGEAAAELAGLVHRWRRFPFLDPDLPAQLLASDWPGAQAAQLFARLRSARLEPASQWWHENEQTHTVSNK